MSVEAISWALKQPLTSSSAKFVLVVIANCADGRSFTAYPSVAYLAQATGQDRKTVIKNLGWLVAGGYLADTGQRVGHTRSIIVYRLSDPKNGTAHEAPSSTEIGIAPEPISGPKNGTPSDAEAVPKTGLLDPEAVPFFPTSSPNFPYKQSQKRDTEPSGIRQGNKTKESGRASRLPDSGQRPFPLPTAWHDFARSENPTWTDAEIQRIADNFADYWTASPRGTKRDWLATWRTWVRKENDRGTHQRHAQRVDNSAPARVARACAERERRAAERAGDDAPVAADDKNLRPPLDGGFRRIG